MFPQFWFKRLMIETIVRGPKTQKKTDLQDCCLSGQALVGFSENDESFSISTLLNEEN